MSLGSVVVIGASLAGIRAAEELRRRGYAGELTIVGKEEQFPPYDRPPLSKEVLLGTWEIEQARLSLFEELSAKLILGQGATALDVRDREVTLEDGSRIPFDGLVIATGATVRRFRGPGGDLDTIYVLRSVDDCIRLRAALERNPRVAIVGAGFIGAEIASCCRARGLEVTLIDVATHPIAEAIGEEMAEYVISEHLAHGTKLRLGVGVSAIREDRVDLADDSHVEADVVVVGIGVAPEMSWLESSELVLDNGVVCDAFLRALGTTGIVAAGDVARWLNPLYGVHMRVEHWTNAVEQAEFAANTLLYGTADRAPFASIPYFWSHQYGNRLQFIGQRGPHVRVVEGSIEEGKFVVVYERLDRTVGALCVNWPARLQRYRKLILESAW